MSEQKQVSFMQELDAWTETNVITPLHKAITDGDEAAFEAAHEGVKRAIRTKVLDSYHNGQRATAASTVRPVRKEWRK
jgi:hypothetical protein